MIASVHRDDPDRVAVGIEVVAREIACSDGESLSRGDREEAVPRCDGCSVGQQFTQLGARPRHAVREAVRLGSAAIGRKRVDHGNAVVERRGETEDDGFTTSEQPLDGDIRGREADELDDVGRTRGVRIHDRVAPVTAREDVAIAAGAARQRVIALTAGETVGTVEAGDRVAARARDVDQCAGPHRVTVPHRTVGETENEALPVAVSRGECATKDQSVAIACKGDDEIVAVDAGAHR